MKNLFLALMLGFYAVPSTAAASASYSFECITDTSSANCAIGEAQIEMTVSDTAITDQVLFEFTNVGSEAASITDIYFDDGTLLAISQIFNGTGVSFSILAKPAELPGANNVTPSFDTTAGFSADSNPPVSGNGVNPGESIGILFTLLASQTYADVIDALAIGSGDNGLLVGVHVQSIGANSGSESFINTVSVVPEPGRWLMMLVGMLFMALRAMRLQG